MGKKYNIEPMTDEELSALEAKFPKAVKTVRRMNYGVVSKLLDCGVDVPGIRLRKTPGQHIMQTNALAQKVAAEIELPGFLKKDQHA